MDVQTRAEINRITKLLVSLNENNSFDPEEQEETLKSLVDIIQKGLKGCVGNWKPLTGIKEVNAKVFVNNVNEIFWKNGLNGLVLTIDLEHEPEPSIEFNER